MPIFKLHILTLAATAALTELGALVAARALALADLCARAGAFGEPAPWTSSRRSKAMHRERCLERSAETARFQAKCMHLKKKNLIVH